MEIIRPQPQKNSTIKVFIADDSLIIRDHLKERFSEIDNLELIGEAENVQNANETLKTILPDVVILDIRMPDGSGMSVLEEIKKRKEKHPKVIIYTSFGHPQFKESYLKAGADYFLDKNHDIEHLIKVILNVHKAANDEG